MKLSKDYSLSLRKDLKRPVWVMYWREDGRKRRKALPAARNKREARAVADAIWEDLNQVNRGEDGFLAEMITVERLVNAFLRRDGIAEATRRIDTQKGAIIKERLGNRVAIHLRPRDLDDYISERQAKGVSGSTINREIAVLRGAIRYAERRREIPFVALQFPRATVIKKRQRALNAKEIAKLLEAAENYRGLRDELTVMFNTACRPSELYRITARDIDLRHRTLRIRNHKKGASSTVVERLIPIAPSVVKVFRRLRKAAGDGPIFPARQLTNLRKSMQTAARRAGIEHVDDISPYTARRSQITLWLRAGVPVKDVAYIAGHADPALTLRLYAVEDVEAARNAIKKVFH